VIVSLRDNCENPINLWEKMNSQQGGENCDACLFVGSLERMSKGGCEGHITLSTNMFFKPLSFLIFCVWAQVKENWFVTG